jgi:hypothetical protein
MELKTQWLDLNKGALTRVLQWVNLRPEESDRTWLMFAFYTVTSVGLRWSEDSSVALFLDEYGAKYLPWIYIASAVTGSGLVYIYSWLQRIFPLRWVIVAIAPCMFLPMILLRLGLHVEHFQVFTVFLLRLWVDAFYVLNDLNTSIAANQLFNIREIKRAYPLISSGILVADILSGFSLPFLLLFVGLDNIIIPIAGGFIVFGAVILWYLSHNYRQAFPNTPEKLTSKVPGTKRRHLTGPLKRYALLLFAFFCLLQIIGILIDFQYLTQLKLKYNDKEIASFLGIFGGVAGLFELGMQLFISSRVLEKFGVFVSVATLPTTVLILIPLTIPLLGLFPVDQAQSFFWGLVILKFLDEILRYTFVVSSGPLLFQPIPDKIRSHLQTLAGGIAEAFGSGIAGVVILVTLGLTAWIVPMSIHNSVLVVETLIACIICLVVIWFLRSHYVDLLVVSAGRGQLSGADVDLPAFKKAVIKTLGEKGSDTDKRSCIELLSQIDPQGATDILAPLLVKLSPDLQQPSLEVMLSKGANPAYLTEVQALLQYPKLPPEVFALALRYVWLAEANPDLSKLEQYLQPQQHSLIRATAAALLLRQGNTIQKVAATKTLRRMLTHKQERERMHGVRALKEAVYLHELRIHIPNLLQDESLRVRCAVLEMIAAINLEEYYSALLGGLYYKSTRYIAIGALVSLENETLPMLVEFAICIYKPEVVRMHAWRTIGQIPTLEAMDTLWQHLETSKGTTRGHVLRTLLKRHQQEEISSLLVGRLHESKVEKLIDEELEFLGEIYAAYIDFKTQGEVYANYIEFKTRENLNNYQSSRKVITILELLKKSLLELEIDVKERLLLLLKLIYPADKIQAAAFNLRSDLPTNLGRGLEILEHTVDLGCKSVLLHILDKQSPEEKLLKLLEAGITKYEQMVVSERTRRLLGHENLLSDWCLACCFHFAQVACIRLASSQILVSLRHPTGFVREAAIAYLHVASRNVLLKILPQLQNDSHPLVIAQVKGLMEKYQG